MKISFALFCASLMLAVVACTAAPKTLPPGEYSRTETHSNSAGTTTEETNTNVYYDQYGNKKVIQQTDKTEDPKGLMNKQTTTTTKAY